jgi:hypothetical protein
VVKQERVEQRLGADAMRHVRVHEAVVKDALDVAQQLLSNA